MRSLLALVLMWFSLTAAFANDIEINSEDCNFEVRKERDGVILRVSKMIAISNSISSWEIEIPKEKVKLPFTEDFKSKVSASGDVTIISYKQGKLVHDNRSTMSFSRNILELTISPDLQTIKHAVFTKKGTGILSLFGNEKFECKF